MLKLVDVYFFLISVLRQCIQVSAPSSSDCPSFRRRQLELRLQPGGADFREAVAKEVAAVEEKHNQKAAELQEKLSDSRKQYAALEDEFRMALTIEAARFTEVC